MYIGPKKVLVPALIVYYCVMNFEWEDHPLMVVIAILKNEAEELDREGKTVNIEDTIDMAKDHERQYQA